MTIPFEIHITADENIHAIAKTLGVKTISVDLLRPDLSVIRTEHMTSFVHMTESYEKCKAYVDLMVMAITAHIGNPTRVKIESPFRKDYVEQSSYIESHFKSDDNRFPLSRSRHKPDKMLGTDRTYDKTEYDMFRRKWNGSEIELCLYDSYIDEDLDWMDMYVHV